MPVKENKNKKNFKFSDTLTDSSYSKLDQYWIKNSMNFFYPHFRGGKSPIPKGLKEKVDSQEKITELFKIKGFQFGNWLSVEDKYNYVTATIHCLYDLNKVVRFNYNVGLNYSLGVAYGARGSGSAMAHFEAATNIINLTRYKRSDRAGGTPKLQRFLYTGGVGSFAHEYGHFLDSYFGAYADRNKKHFSLSGWGSTYRGDIEAKKGSMRETMNKILEIAYWKNRDKKIPSSFYNRIRQTSDRPYWVERAEIFARIFEQYVSSKLQRGGIYNIFLSQKKYTNNVYMTPHELRKVEPYIDKLLGQMRDYV